jgi:hypothetical protein
MAIVKEIEIKVNTSGAGTDIEKINDLFKQVDKSVNTAEKTTGSLRSELRKLQQDMASGKLSGAEFNAAAKRAGELKDAIGDVAQRVNILSSDTQKLDAVLSAGSGIAGAFSVAQGAMGAFGGESEEVNEAILKVQSSLAILNGVQAVANTLNKDSALMVQLQSRGLVGLTAVQKVYSAVVGTSTGMLKAFRIALVSTGIVAIVFGLGLLIANFETVSKWVTDLVDKFGGWRKVLMFISPPIYLIIKALEMLGIIDDEQTAKNKKNAEERIKAQKKESAELDKKRAQVGEYYDFEIRKAKASGKNTEEIEAQKRRALLDTLKTQNELEKSWIRTGKATSEDIKRWNDRQKEISKLLQDIEVASLEAEKVNNERAEKAREEQKKKAEERKRMAEAERKALLDLEKNYLQQVQDLEDKTEEQKLARQRERAMKSLEDMKGTEADKQKARLQLVEFYDGKELELQTKKKEESDKLETERQKRVTEIQNEFAMKRRELEAVTEEQKRNLELEKIDIEREKRNQELIELGVDYDQRLEILKSFELQKSNLIADFAQQDLEREKILQQQRVALAGQTAGNIANALGQTSKAGKAFAVAQALINTYQGISAELATKTATPFEFGLKLANIASTAVIGFKAVKDIIKTNPSASGGGASAPSGGGAGGGAPQFNLVGNTGVNQIASQIGQDQQPQRAYVVSGDVTTQQALDRNIVQNATIG